MSEHTIFFSATTRVYPGKAQAYDSREYRTFKESRDDDGMSSMQALINILRKPHEVACDHCWGTGVAYSGYHCKQCGGRGRKLSSALDY